MDRRHKRRKWAKRILKKRQRSPDWRTVVLAVEDVAGMAANTLARRFGEVDAAMSGNLEMMRGVPVEDDYAPM